MRNIHLSLFVSLLMFVYSVSIAQENNTDENISIINQILEDYPSESSSFNVTTKITYSFNNYNNMLTISEKTTSSYENQIKQYFLPFNDIKSQGISVNFDNELINIMFNDYGSDKVYIKYHIESSNGNSEGLESNINIYLGNIPTNTIETLSINLNNLFNSISDGEYYYSNEQSTDYDGYTNYNKDSYSTDENDYYYSDDNYDSGSTDNYNYDDYNNYDDDYSNIEDPDEITFEYYNEDGTRIYNRDNAYYFRTLEYNDEGTLVAYDFSEEGALYRKAELLSRDPNDRNNDILNGACFWYYENGNLQYFAIYEKGYMINNEYIEIDEEGKATSILDDEFTDNSCDWSLRNRTDSYTYMESGYLYIESKNNYQIPELIKYDIDPNSNFIIDAKLKLIYGDNDSGCGLIWGFKDWDNFSRFRISNDGYYEILTVFDGIKIEISEGWQKSSTINQNNEWNRLQMNKYDDKIYFSINGHIVKTSEFYSFKGKNIGFGVGPERKVQIDNFTVKQDFHLSNKGSSNDGERESGRNNNNEGFIRNGSGFFIDTEGYIATNYHVVKDASIIVVEYLRDGNKQKHSAKVIQVDKQNDLAIIKIIDSDFTPFYSIPYNFKINTSDVGTNVFALGYPMALSLMGTEIKFTDGKISSKTGIQGNITTYQMTVPVQGGNSGGPLFDYSGNLIGITSSKIMSSDVDNVSYAIKSSYLKNLVDAMPNHIYLPDDTSISDEKLTEKIKILSPYVVLVLVK